MRAARREVVARTGGEVAFDQRLRFLGRKVVAALDQRRAEQLELLLILAVRDSKPAFRLARIGGAERDLVEVAAGEGGRSASGVLRRR